MFRNLIKERDLKTKAAPPPLNYHGIHLQRKHQFSKPIKAVAMAANNHLLVVTDNDNHIPFDNLEVWQMELPL